MSRQCGLSIITRSAGHAPALKSNAPAHRGEPPSPARLLARNLRYGLAFSLDLGILARRPFGRLLLHQAQFLDPRGEFGDLGAQLVNIAL